MTNIVNLNRARKKKTRTDKEKSAKQNRAKFSRTKADKKKSASDQSKLAKHLDGHKAEE